MNDWYRVAAVIQRCKPQRAPSTSGQISAARRPEITLSTYKVDRTAATPIVAVAGRGDLHVATRREGRRDAHVGVDALGYEVLVCQAKKQNLVPMLNGCGICQMAAISLERPFLSCFTVWADPHRLQPGPAAGAC